MHPRHMPTRKEKEDKENLIYKFTTSVRPSVTELGSVTDERPGPARQKRDSDAADRTAGRRTKRRADGRMSRDPANERAHDGRRSGTDRPSSVHGPGGAAA